MKHEIPMSDIINEGYYKSIYASASCEKSAPLNLDKSKEWLDRSDKVVPGGAQTYSKSWRHHIKGVTPIFLESGDGCWVKDVDEFLHRFYTRFATQYPWICGSAC